MGVNVINTPVFQGLYEPVTDDQGTGEYQTNGGTLSNITYGTNGPTSWNEGSTSYTATYNSDGTLATVTGGGIVKTFTYSAGQLTGVTTGAV